MGWLIALGVLIGLAILPLGVSATYNTTGPQVRLIIGPVRLLVYPRKKTKPKDSKSRSVEKRPREQRSGGSAADFAPLLQKLWEFLKDTKGKLRVKRLEMKLILAGQDPCDLAVNYGKAWAALGNLIPLLEHHFVIKKRDMEVECDFTSDETKIYARLDITITVIRLLSLCFRHGIPALRQYLNVIKLRKGGAKT